MVIKILKEEQATKVDSLPFDGMHEGTTALSVSQLISTNFAEKIGT